MSWHGVTLQTAFATLALDGEFWGYSAQKIDCRAECRSRCIHHIIWRKFTQASNF